MIKFEDFQSYGKEHIDAAMESAGNLSKGVQAIATAVSDYSRKTFEQGSAFVEKLGEVKSFDKVVEAQADYAKTAYESFVADGTKISELCVDLAKESYKPFEAYMAKMTTN